MSDIEHHPAVERRARRAAHLVLGGFALATVGAVLAIIGHLRGWSTQALGACWAVAFAGFGVGLVAWANGLLAEEHVQEREPLAGDPAGERAVADEISRGGAFARRTVLRRGLWLAGGAVGASIVVPLRSLGPSPGRKLLHTSWGPGVGAATIDGTLVRAGDVPVDGLLTVFPEHDLGAADAQAVLVRVDPALLDLPEDRRSWAPSGVIAFSKLCSHAGCPVGLYQAATHQLLCPCHQSAFDVLRGARPISGPAAWPLPQLPLTIDAQGIVRATADFDVPVGPGWWRT